MNVKDAAQVKRFAAEKMVKASLFDTDHLYCDLYCFEPGQEQKPHVHEGSEKIYYVLEGRGTFQIGDEKRELGEHFTVHAPPGVSHGVKNESRERLVVLTIMTPRP